MNMKKSFGIFAIVILLLITFFLVFGCSLFFRDEDAPLPDSRTISVKSLKGTEVTVSWKQAADDTTAADKIIYSLYYSTQNKMQVADDVKASSLVQKGNYGDFTAGTDGEMAGTISGLLPDKIYYINVIAEDLSGNGALYSQVNISSTRYSDSFSGGTYGMFKHGTMNASVGSSLLYTVNLNSSVKDVYFIFSNVDRYNDRIKPSVQVLSSTKGVRSLSGAAKGLTALDLSAGSEQPAGYRGRPNVTEFNNSPVKRPPAGVKSLGNYYESPSMAVSDTVGKTETFYDLDSSNNPVEIYATCRAVFADTDPGGTGKTLNIWVANDCWEGALSGKANLVTQSMVNNLQANFLKSGTGNDVYDWVTAIFGQEWGSHSYSNLIPPDDNITIILYDIDNDNSTTGGVLGFFWAKDNYKRTAPGTDPILDYSNERIMFYIDSVMYAEPESEDSDPDGSIWGPTDYWPLETVSTLAHEFQHMIHFYQHSVLMGANTETWINELCSMATEDIVSYKLGTPGPRGVDSTDPTAGSRWLQGRLNRYNYKDYLDVTKWLSGNDVLYSYSITYSFGAYLIRNFGGATFLKNTVQNSENSGSDMVTYALRLAGDPNDSMANRLGDWAAAAMLSKFTDLPADYRYNAGAWFTSSSGGVNYKLGSINMYNYTYLGVTGPYVFDSSNYDGISKIEASSNTIYRAGQNLTGKNRFLIAVPANTGLTVVVR